MSITFETKCWEGDWKYLLKEGYLEMMIRNCTYPFDSKVLYINNVTNRQEVESFAQEKISQGTIDKYVVVEDYADEALQFFNLHKDDFKGGYYYSIAELVSIYLCKTDLLLHFSSDAHLEENNQKWVEKAIKLLAESNDYFVANPVWNHNFEEAKSESISETEDNYIGYGFSDQCYMIRTADFKKPIYSEINPTSERYPKYGGELFEKRVDAYMRNHKLLRATSKTASYIHENHPKKKSFIKRLLRL